MISQNCPDPHWESAGLLPLDNRQNGHPGWLISDDFLEKTRDGIKDLQRSTPNSFLWNGKLKFICFYKHKKKRLHSNTAISVQKAQML